MPRADISNREEWIAGLRAGQSARAEQVERLTQVWAFAILMATVLYLMIGSAPYTRGTAVDAATGGAAISPVNRYIWIVLGAASMPILYVRRHMLLDVAKRIWPLLLLFGWFTMTTQWALDHATSSRRLFVYIIGLLISVALATGLDSGRRFHRALAYTCAVMVAIDVASTILLPGLSMTDIGLAAIHSHKNTLGLVMMFCCLVVGPYLLGQTTASGRWLWGLTLLAAFILLVASRSKTSLAILIVIATSAPILLGALKLGGKTLAAIGAAIVLALFGALLVWLAYCTSTGRNPMAPLYGLTFTQRTDVWAFVISEIMKRPFAGAGFASFWDIDPALQPSLLNGDLWFATVGAFTSEAHNGYLDLLVTTGAVGLAGALAVLMRWVCRGLMQIRRTLRSNDSEMGLDLPWVTTLGLFPLMIFGHNFMESSYFTPNSFLGTMILLVGVDLDIRYGRRTAALRSRTTSKPAMMTTSRA
jgi:O-antigen ligase